MRTGTLATYLKSSTTLACRKASKTARTGAAIITAVCERFGPVPPMTILATGYGAGARDHQNFPNALRLFVGETEEAAGVDEALLMIETNVDDTSPQIVGYVMDKALELGALECYLN